MKTECHRNSIWDLHFTSWENILKVLVCPDIIRKVIPELTSVTKTDAFFFFLQDTCKETPFTKKREKWLPSPASYLEAF